MKQKNLVDSDDEPKSDSESENYDSDDAPAVGSDESSSGSDSSGSSSSDSDSEPEKEAPKKPKIPKERTVQKFTPPAEPAKSEAGKSHKSSKSRRSVKTAITTATTAFTEATTGVTSAITQTTATTKFGKAVVLERPELAQNQKAAAAEDDEPGSDADSNAPAGDRSREPSPEKKEEPAKPANKSVLRTGGAYLPPAKARLLQQQIADKQSEQYQRLAWDALKKSINGLVNKVNIGNISIIVRELFQENLVRGRGILAKAIMQAQVFSPTFTQVYAALVAVINTRLPQVGELLCKRLIVTFRKSYKRQDKSKCQQTIKFIAHLVNQNVCHEIIALETLSLLLQENPTDDSVEVAITFLKEVGFKLAELSPRGLTVVMERLRHILHEGMVNLRTQYAIEVMMAVRKDGFKEHLPIREGLDLVEEEDQITHMLQLDGKYQVEDMLNIFRYDKTYLENEANYKGIRDEILGSSDDSDGSGSDSSSDSSEETSSEEELDDAAMAEKAAQARENGKKIDIFDKTSTDIVHYRRTLYLTIQSSLDYEECAHKLLKINVGEDMTLIKIWG